MIYKLFSFFILFSLFTSCKKEERYTSLEKGILVLKYEDTGKTDTISYEKDSIKYLEYKSMFPIKDGMISVLKISRGNYKKEE